MSINIKKNLWCILLISVFFILLIIFISLFVYEQTKSSYMEVGSIYGSTRTKIEMVEKIRGIMGDDNSCDEMYTDDNFTAITFITVKTTAVYAVKYDNGLIGFCLRE
jgi:hypothetical protein